MKIRPDSRWSPVQTVDAAQNITLSADHALTAVVEVSQNGFQWQAPTPRIVLPAAVATPLHPDLLKFKYFRLRIQPQSYIITVTVIKTAADSTLNLDEDLRVPDLVRTRSSTIERDGAGDITKVTRTGGREIDISRDETGQITSWADNENTWNVDRDESDDITGVTVE